MSRIGMQPVEVPSEVTVTVQGETVSVKGSKGDLSVTLPAALAAEVKDGKVIVTRRDETKQTRGFHGLFRTLIANMIEGVSKGFKKELEIEGVGFRAAVQGQNLSISLGFAYPVEYELPAGITAEIDGNGTKVAISGADKQMVGDVAARIRSFYPAEPYKGKGVKYKGERIRRKVGKTVA